ncbi:MAG: polysulfide reductase, partial [Gemmatimonadetes bacterium]|nr:polysulfide reductase [Gemmatimonadota bacterium]NIR73616.1 polysulfide reductase [Candidatus Kutchimonas denitrificans]NIR99575.1 polysulfide reductase [Gemmatimonadota bacterium]NIT65195.1 polysulfide reductase [Gemmatimonadota bacterium]NIV23728.1 polysulfide reductase [Gemmatimonadota bacterium]
SSPHWAWYITFYFYIGGIAGGAFFLASLLHVFGAPEDRPVVRQGYYIAFAGAVVSGILLTLDLKRPLRFWHMLIENNTGQLIFKAWSPMSVGAWGLLLFGLFAFLATVGALAEEGKIRWEPVRRLSQATIAWPLAAAVGAIGSFLGFFLAGYTGVLLSVTNRPIWADSNFVGAVFIFSAASTGAAALILMSRWRGGGHPASMHWLSRVDRGALALELLALIVLVISLGSVAGVLVSAWGVLLVLGVVILGIVVPFVLEARSASHVDRRLVTAAALVLFGGFLLRVFIIFSSESIYALGSGVAMP